MNFIKRRSFGYREKCSNVECLPQGPCAEISLRVKNLNSRNITLKMQTPFFVMQLVKSVLKRLVQLESAVNESAGPLTTRGRWPNLHFPSEGTLEIRSDVRLRKPALKWCLRHSLIHSAST